MVAELGRKNGRPPYTLGYEYILDHGIEYTSDEIDHKSSKAVKQKYGCKLKECYANCQRIVVNPGSGFYYCEGFATCTAGLPLSHAWLVDACGKIVDPTWLGSKYKLCGDDYFGIVIPEKFIRKAILKSNVWTELLMEFIWMQLKKEGKINGPQ